jgi:putative SOS response-associated peptidase YedK
MIHNRIPVILDPGNFDRWPVDRMCAWQVSDRVGNVRNNDMAILDPASPIQLQNHLPLN